VNLRARLLGLMLLATLLPALLMAVRYVRDSEASVAAATTLLKAQADNIAADLAQRVQGTAQLQYGLGYSRVLDSGDRAACSAHLSNVREAYPQYTGILTVLPDGTLFCDSLRTGRQLNLADRAYFQRARASRDAVPMLEPAFGRLTGTSVLQVAMPVRDDAGALRYVLLASLNLQSFAQGSLRQALPQAPQLLLMDARGTVMAWAGVAQPPQPPGSSLAGSPLFALAGQQAGGGVASIPAAAAAGGATVWAVAAPQGQPTGLYVMLGLPQADLVAGATRRLRQDLLVLSATAALLFVAVWLLAEWGIRRPVGRINRMVRDLGDGDLGARIAPPYARGELGGLMAALNSTAASLQAQRTAIDALGARLQQAQKLEAIGTLAGGIAHDFNNIIGAVLGNLSLAHEEALAGRPVEPHLSEIRRAALRARDLVQRIQTFGRRDAPAPSRQHLQQVVDEVLALVRVALPAGVELHTELQAEPLYVRGDATQLHQVLMNLCTNAWQALQGAPGRVVVGLRAEVFDLGAHPAPPGLGLGAGRHAHLWVADTGRGIEAGDRERIFEPFFTTKGARGGSGLGLSVVHGIVQAHGGGIVVDSVPGQGSRFHIYLPALADDALPAPAPASGPEPASPGEVATPAAPAGRGQQVLYIDDDEVMGLMVERLLGRAGYRVTCHQSAQQALAAVRAAPGAPDLVITDFNMPELSGLDVARSLRELWPGLPVVIISGHVFEELPAQARRAGVRELVRKQHVLEELVPAVARALAAADAAGLRSSR